MPGAVIDFAARLLPRIAPQLTPPHSVRRHRGELDLRLSRRSAADVIIATNQALEREGTVGVIVPDAAVPTVRKTLEKADLRYDLLGEDAQIFDTRIDLVPASLAKGLEFDHVVLLEPADIVAGEPDEVTGLRRLYVCLTRAVTSLVVVHSAPLPAALRRAPRRLTDPSTAHPDPLRPGLLCRRTRIVNDTGTKVRSGQARVRVPGVPGGPAASVTAAPSGRARLRGP